MKGLVRFEDSRLPVRRIPLREKPLQRYFLPYRGLVGLLLIAITWPLSQQTSQNVFFPLWLGFILFIDGLVLRRTATSLIVRSPRIVAVMFLLPYWWVFEGINEITQNWIYVSTENGRGIVDLIESSLSYSTVIPVVFEMSELVGSFSFIKRFERMRALVLSRRQVIFTAVLGVLSMAAMLVWPTYLFPLTWVSLFLFFDPINHMAGRPSIISQVKKGDYRMIVAFGLGALVCGFFWEMWNRDASVAWEYNIGYLDFARIFEMPLLGYLGYPPFGLETYAIFHFVAGLLGWSSEAEVPLSSEALPGTA
ncbi:MAG: hypothetical protein O3A93_04700 [Chloroflexi bacterium]|nr:hypothetical protein [Chloroflexota bacterium]MDA1270542.1 hypothetical protein [Chloroflexota bacterium]PKB58822.1 MAG: hypothetical protein BZY83_04975 [SAR202 cluster bacterium Casp-Chloro-G2]